MFGRYTIGLIAGLAILLTFPLAGTFANSPTGYEVAPEFQSFYDASGGLPVFGYAVTEPGQEDGRLVQYFERQRLELHPENAGTPYEVLLGHLGWQEVDRRGLRSHEAFQRQSDDGQGMYFSETGQNLSGRFMNYWTSNGLNFGDQGVSFRESLALFGFPVSDEFVDPDTGLVTQYFERARFEYHPEHDGTEYDVLLGHLGIEEMDFLRANGRGPDGQGPPGQRTGTQSEPTAAPEPTATPAPTATPQPEPTSEPQQTEPAPAPTATPQPEPTPAPAPTATPEPEPTAMPAPAPTATPEPEPTPTPAPIADPVQEPNRSIQEMVNNASNGATVRVPAGIYRETVTINKPITLIGEPGAEIRGDDASGNVVREHWIVGAANNVTIEGFTMRYASNRVQTGAISNNGYDNWTIRNNTLSHANGANVSLRDGNNLRLINNVIHDGGQLGVHGSHASQIEVRGNEIYNNNTNGNDAGWEAGGLKFAAVTDVIMDGNTVYGNDGPGLWCDIDCDDVVFSNNTVHHNENQGIKYEISFNAKIHDNVVFKNGYGFQAWGWGAGIMSQNSSNVEIYDNVVAWNADGIVVISQNRGRARWNEISDTTIRDNAIMSVATQPHHDFALGWLQDWDGHLGAAGANNTGANNAYYHANPGNAWMVFAAPDGKEFQHKDLGQFNQTAGENNGRELSTNEKNQILNAAGVPTSP